MPQHFHEVRDQALELGVADIAVTGLQS